MVACNYAKAMPSPWGKVDYIFKIAPGVMWVGTPSHGGLLVGKKVARDKLSAKAIECAFPGAWAQYIAFEEDCAYALALYECPAWDAGLSFTAFPPRDPAERHEELRQIIERWMPEYFN